MNFLKKLNRGLILTVLILVAVIVYLIYSNASTSAMMPKVKEACNTYIEDYTKYKKLPSKYISSKKKMPKKAIDAYVKTMVTEMKKHYYSNEGFPKNQLEEMKNLLRAQADGNDKIFNYEIKVEKFTNITFKDDTVTAEFTSTTKWDGPDYMDQMNKRSKFTTTEDNRIILKKQGAAWKVVYSSITNPINRDRFKNSGYTRTEIVK